MPQVSFSGGITMPHCGGIVGEKKVAGVWKHLVLVLGCKKGYAAWLGGLGPV
jgi:hypothetical protein